MDEFLKIGNFVDHFLTHKEDDSRLTLFRFIEMHYLGHDLNDNDDTEDNKLPFKAPNAAHFHTVQASITADPFSFKLGVAQTDGLLNVFRLYQQSGLPSSYLSDIWQPPKACC